MVSAGSSSEEVVPSTAEDVIGSSSPAELVRLSSAEELILAANRTNEVTAIPALNVITERASDDDVVAGSQDKK